MVTYVLSVIRACMDVGMILQRKTKIRFEKYLSQHSSRT